MTRSIEDTPVRERTLLVCGRVSPASQRLAGAGLPSKLGPNEIVVFLSYNYAEVPVGTKFEACYSYADPGQVRWVESEVVAVTQQFSVAWDEIPHGWKTLAVLRFDPGVPDLITQMPEVDAWSHIEVLISSRATWIARQEPETSDEGD